MGLKRHTSLRLEYCVICPPTSDWDGSSPAPDNTPTDVKVPGVDYPLPADDALQILQDPAAELARLAEGKVPQSNLDGYDPLAGRSFEDFQEEFTIRGSDGNLQWDWDHQAPNNGFAGDPIETNSIPEGHRLDRLGSNRVDSWPTNEHRWRIAQ